MQIPASRGSLRHENGRVDRKQIALGNLSLSSNLPGWASSLGSTSGKQIELEGVSQQFLTEQVGGLLLALDKQPILEPRSAGGRLIMGR
jgi:hypothetical protein